MQELRHFLLQIDTTRPFRIFLETDSRSRRGEQLGVEVNIFNTWHQDLEVSKQPFAALTLKSK